MHFFYIWNCLPFLLCQLTDAGFSRFHCRFQVFLLLFCLFPFESSLSRWLYAFHQVLQSFLVLCLNPLLFIIVFLFNQLHRYFPFVLFSCQAHWSHVDDLLHLQQLCYGFTQNGVALFACLSQLLLRFRQFSLNLCLAHLLFPEITGLLGDDCSVPFLHFSFHCIYVDFHLVPYKFLLYPFFQNHLF